MMSGWVTLFGAILAELIATTALRASEGLTRLGPVVIVVVGYALAFALLARTLTQLPLGVAYAVWSGFGTLGAVLAGWALFGERLGWNVVLGVALLGLGTVALHLGGAHSPPESAVAPPPPPRAPLPASVGDV